MPAILITNDDGISSPGIKSLSIVLNSLGDVYIVAPESEQSAVARSLTLHRPLRFQQIEEKTFSVNGTPTDCVIIAVSKLIPQKPDVIVSGINHGGNMGDNISYSGTVAAAMEGTILGIPSIAFSLALNDNGTEIYRETLSKFEKASIYARELTEKVLNRGLPEDTLLNVNIPDTLKIKGVRITKQGKLIYDNSIHEISDPRGRKHFWIGGGIPQWEAGEDTDFDAVNEEYVSVTPIHLDLTNYKALDYLVENWDLG